MGDAEARAEIIAVLASYRNTPKSGQLRDLRRVIAKYDSLKGITHNSTQGVIDKLKAKLKFSDDDVIAVAQQTQPRPLTAEDASDEMAEQAPPPDVPEYEEPDDAVSNTLNTVASLADVVASGLKMAGRNSKTARLLETAAKTGKLTAKALKKATDVLFAGTPIGVPVLNYMGHHMAPMGAVWSASFRDKPAEDARTQVPGYKRVVVKDDYCIYANDEQIIAAFRGSDGLFAASDHASNAGALIGKTGWEAHNKDAIDAARDGIVEYIEKEEDAGRTRRKLTVAGYSRGAMFAMSVSEKLRRAGGNIETVVSALPDKYLQTQDETFIDNNKDIYAYAIRGDVFTSNSITRYSPKGLRLGEMPQIMVLNDGKFPAEATLVGEHGANYVKAHRMALQTPVYMIPTDDPKVYKIEPEKLREAIRDDASARRRRRLGEDPPEEGEFEGGNATGGGGVPVAGGGDGEDGGEELPPMSRPAGADPQAEAAAGADPQAEAAAAADPQAGAAAAAVVDEDKSATPTGEGGPDPLDLTARYGPDMGGVGGGTPGSGTFGYSVRPGLRAAVNAQFHRYGKNFRTAVSEFGASKRYLDMKAETGGDGHQSLDRLLANYGSIVGIGALDHRQLDDAAMSSLYLEVGAIVDWFLRNPERLVARSVNNLAGVLRSGGAAGGGAAQVLGGGFGGVSSVKEFAQALMRGVPAMVQFDSEATLGDAAGIVANQGQDAATQPGAGSEAAEGGTGRRTEDAGTGPGNRRRLAPNGSYTRHIDPALRAQGVDRDHRNAGTGAVAGEVHPSGAATGDAFEAPELVAEHDRTQRANPGVITREGKDTFRLDTTKFRDSTGGTATRYDVALPYDGGGYKLAFTTADDDDEAPVLDFPYPEVTGLMPANFMSQSVSNLKAINLRSGARVAGNPGARNAAYNPGV